MRIKRKESSGKALTPNEKKFLSAYLSESSSSLSCGESAKQRNLRKYETQNIWEPPKAKEKEQQVDKKAE
jgi:hypothetical protein